MIRPASKLSAAIIARDEELRIGDCLDSVRWVDEIVVVDTGSRDRTLEVCQTYTPHVYSYPWEGYAAAKNTALAHTTGDLILSLDADERVSGELRAEISTLRQQPLETLADGYAIPRRNYLWGRWLRHGGLYPDYQLRLFKRGKGRFNRRRVHESVEVTGRVGYLPCPLDHYSYRGLGDFIERLNRYTELAAQDRYEHGPSFHTWTLVTRPLARFLRNYLLQQGFRDGLPGLLIAVSYAYGVFAREAKLWELTRGREAGPQAHRKQ
ncbi:MAG: glycosyltransferase family 2 protein [Candidatus Entotheonellia bacterium]